MKCHGVRAVVVDYNRFTVAEAERASQRFDAWLQEIDAVSGGNKKRDLGLGRRTPDVYARKKRATRRLDGRGHTTAAQMLGSRLSEFGGAVAEINPWDLRKKAWNVNWHGGRAISVEDHVEDAKHIVCPGERCLSRLRNRRGEQVSTISLLEHSLISKLGKAIGHSRPSSVAIVTSQYAAET